jgi:DNA-binding MurR/RpiR family transcriptional regulator
MTPRELIRSRYAELSPSLQLGARFLLDHPNEVVVASMRTIAERAGVPPATLVRLAQQLGFAGWPQLKEGFVAELGLSTKAYGQRAKSLQERRKDKALVGEMFEVQRDNLQATEAHNATSLQRAARLLEQAKQVHVAGFRASFPIAHTLVYVYRLFRASVQLIDGAAGGLEMQLRALAKGDALVVVSFAPYSREALQALQAARRAGCKVLAFTDSEASPLALDADACVLFSVRSPSFFPSIAAGVAAAEALLEMLVAQAGAAGVAQIERAEAHLFDTGAYLQPPPRRGRA